MPESPTTRRLAAINQNLRLRTRNEELRRKIHEIESLPDSKRELLSEFFELTLELDKIKNGKGSASVAPPSVDEIREMQNRLTQLGEAINTSVLPGEIKAVADAAGVSNTAAGSSSTQPASNPLGSALKALQKNKDIQDAIGTGINVLSNVIDLGISRSQVKESDRALRNLNKPLPPKGIQANINLQQAISQLSGQTAYADQLPEINAARQDIADTFQTQVSQANVASGGQAGQFQAYTQAAANQRNKALTNLAGLTSQTRQGMRGQMGQLIGQQIDEERSRAYLDNYQFNTQLGQYNLERNQALQQGSIGRHNQRNAIFSLLGNVGGYLSEQQYIDMDENQYGDLFNDYLNF